MTLKIPSVMSSLKLAAISGLSVVMILLPACSTPPDPRATLPPSTFNTSSDFGGEIVTDAIATTATVVSVDRTKRLVVLNRADGSRVTYKALPNAFGFDDIKAGDLVKVSVAEELAVFLGKSSVPASAKADTAKLRIRLPNGAQDVAAESETMTFTAKVAAIDDWSDAVTLQLPDGTSKTIKVSEAVNLADVSVGDTVSVQSTEAAVVLLAKP